MPNGALTKTQIPSTVLTLTITIYPNPNPKTLDLTTFILLWFCSGVDWYPTRRESASVEGQNLIIGERSRRNKNNRKRDKDGGRKRECKRRHQPYYWFKGLEGGHAFKFWWPLHGRRPRPKSGGTKSENYWFEKPSFFKPSKTSKVQILGFLFFFICPAIYSTNQI